MIEGIAFIMQTVLQAQTERDRLRASESLNDRLRELDCELTFAKDALCDLIDVLQKKQLVTPEVQAIIDRYDARIARLSQLDSAVEAIVAKIDDLLAQGKDIEAVRFYHAEAGGIWDRCHEVTGMWAFMTPSEKHFAVYTDLKRKRALEAPAPAEPNP